MHLSSAKGEPASADPRSRPWRGFRLCWGFDAGEPLQFPPSSLRSEAWKSPDYDEVGAHPSKEGVDSHARLRNERSSAESRRQRAHGVAPSCKRIPGGFGRQGDLGGDRMPELCPHLQAGAFDREAAPCRERGFRRLSSQCPRVGERPPHRREGRDGPAEEGWRSRGDRSPCDGRKSLVPVSLPLESRTWVP